MFRITLACLVLSVLLPLPSAAENYSAHLYLESEFKPGEVPEAYGYMYLYDESTPQLASDRLSLHSMPVSRISLTGPDELELTDIVPEFGYFCRTRIRGDYQSTTGNVFYRQQDSCTGYAKFPLPETHANPIPEGTYEVSVTSMPGYYLLNNPLDMNGDGETDPIAEGVPEINLPPVDSATYSLAYYPNGSMLFTWSLPAVYPDGSAISLDFSAYSDGRFSHKQLRLYNLPANSTSYSMPRALADFLLAEGDQIKAQVRVSGPAGVSWAYSTPQGYQLKDGEMVEADLKPAKSCVVIPMF